MGTIISLTLLCSVRLSLSQIIEEQFSLSSAQSLNDVWSAITDTINSNQSISVTEYISNIAIMSEALEVTESTYLDLPSINAPLTLERITLNINCAETLDACNVNIASNESDVHWITIGDGGSASNTPQISLSMSGINFHIDGDYAVLNINGSYLVDEVILSDIEISCDSFYSCYRPFFMAFADFFGDCSFMVQSMQVLFVDNPIYIYQCAEVDIHNFICVGCDSADSVVMLTDIVHYNLSHIEIYNSSAYALLFLSMPVYDTAVNELNHVVMVNNNVTCGAIYAEFLETNATYATSNSSDISNISSDDIWSNLLIQYVATNSSVVYYYGPFSNLELIDCRIYDTWGGWSSVIETYFVNSVYLDSCHVARSDLYYGAFIADAVYVWVTRTVIEDMVWEGLYESNPAYMLQIEHTTIRRTSFALSTYGVDEISVSHSVFEENEFVMYVNKDFVTITNCTFDRNIGGRSGAALLHQYGRLEIYDSIFSNNQAYEGGAIEVYTLGLSHPGTFIYNTKFINNSAHNGGALMHGRGTLYLDNVEFIGNRARGYGGAVYDYSGFAECEGTGINFMDGNYTAHFGAGLLFQGNRASLGGAVYTTNCDTRFGGDSDDAPIRFVRNSALNLGGALMIDVSVSNITISNAIFEQNAALNGGGAVSLSGGSVWLEGCTFEENAAIYGKGGALLLQPVETFVDDSIRAVIVDSLIRRNTAVYGGGVALDILGVNEDNNQFLQALYPQNDDENPDMYLMRVIRSNLTNNTAQFGGAFYLNHGIAQIEGGVLDGNSARHAGGAVYVEEGKFDAIQQEWSNNAADQFGGAFVSMSIYTTMTNVSIRNNSASEFGGGVYFGECPYDASSGVAIESNAAGLSGADFFVENSEICSWLQYINADDSNDTENAMHIEGVGTFPVRFNVSWQIPSSFSHLDELQIGMTLFDAFDQQVTLLSPQEAFIANLNYSPIDPELESCFLLEGTDVADFAADASIAFGLSILQSCDIYVQNVAIPILFTLTMRYTNNIQASNNLLSTASFVANFHTPIYDIPTGLVIFGHACAALCGLCAAVSAFLTFRYRTHPIIRGARVAFMYLLSAGLFLASFTLSLTVTVPQHIPCSAFIWIFAIACQLIICPLLAKTWSIYRVFDAAENLLSWNWSNRKLFVAFIVVPFVVLAILLICWTVLEVSEETYLAFDSAHQLYLVEQCNYDPAWLISSFVLVIGGVIVLAYYAVKARHIPENYRESKYIFGCILTLVLVMTFLAPFTFLNMDTTIQRIIRILSVFICIQSVLMLLFYVKFNVVWNGRLQKSALDQVGENEVLSTLEKSRTDKTRNDTSSHKTTSTFLRKKKRNKNTAPSSDMDADDVDNADHDEHGVTDLRDHDIISPVVTLEPQNSTGDIEMNSIPGESTLLTSTVSDYNLQTQSPDNAASE